MILTLEGAPATGKTFWANVLSSQGAVRIAEVNALWRRPKPEPADWYLQRQLDRCATACNAQASIAVLDGDHLQPLWFNWMYPDRALQNWRYCLEFFRDNHAEWRLPDRFVLLTVAEPVREHRELARSLALGRSVAQAHEKTARYTGMAANLERWFDDMELAFPGLVMTVDATANTRLPDQALQLPAHAISNLTFLSWAEGWLASHAPQ
jgi:hypothetical protein